MWGRATSSSSLEADEGLLHPPGPGRASRQGVGPAPQARLMVRSTLDADAPYADAVLHGDGAHLSPVPAGEGRHTEQIESAVKGADVLQLERRATPTRSPPPASASPPWSAAWPTCRFGDEVYVGLALCSHKPGHSGSAIFRDVRLIRPARDGFVPYAITSAASSRSRPGQRPSGRSSTVRAPFEAPNWSKDGGASSTNGSGGALRIRGRRFRFDWSRGKRCRSTPASPSATTRSLLSFTAPRLGISDQSRGWTVDHLHRPVGAERQADQRRFAVVPAWLVAGREVLVTPAGGATSSISTVSRRRQRPRGAADRFQRDWTMAGVIRRWPLHLLQLRPPRDDADLAHEAGRQGSGAAHERRNNNGSRPSRPTGR